MTNFLDASPASDEPTRLRRFVAKMFATPAALRVAVSETASAQLLEGADAQDDCAVFRLDGSQELVVGSDYVRGPKFRMYEFGLLDEYDLGYYLVAANISDIAAMGARPIGLLSVVRYPPDMTDDVFASVLRGIRDACVHFDTPNVGGDIGSAERLILSGTALGVCKPEHALLRRGARPGDRLCITGSTGLAGAAMEYFRFGERTNEIDQRYKEVLLSAWKQPHARVREGIILGASGLASSCQDTSDGLKAAIEAISAASDVGFTINEANVPLAEPVLAVADHLDRSALSIVMGDSVDFELLFTVPEQNLSLLRSAFAEQDLNFYEIGLATANESIVMRKRDGSLRDLPGKSWRHRPDREADS